METTTGISAPPIGIIIKTPMASDTIKIPQKAVSEFVVTNARINTTRSMPKNALKGCCNGNETG